MKRYVLVGATSGELLSYQGAVLYHDSRPELEFLFPGCRVVELPRASTLGRPLMPISRHPSMAAVRFPLRREDFV